jgi:hypothetical protein
MPSKGALFIIFFIVSCRVDGGSFKKLGSFPSIQIIPVQATFVVKSAPF